jgi:hypothetical protein
MPQDTVYGRDFVRDAFLVKINDDMQELFSCKNEVEQARGGEPNLDRRLDLIEEEIDNIGGGGVSEEYMKSLFLL